MIELPTMPPEQTASWLGVLDLYDHLSDGWTLIGGQLVHVHCAERGASPVRPTNDADAVIDVRADPTILHTFTRTLTDVGFESAGVSPEGRQHRWVRGTACIDVLLPDGIGERASERPGVTGSPTLANRRWDPGTPTQRDCRGRGRRTRGLRPQAEPRRCPRRRGRCPHEPGRP